MKIKIQKKDLEKGINIAEKAISQRNIQQALSCFHLIVKDNLTIYAMNNEIRIETNIPCEVLEKGEVLINANIFSGIIKKMGGNEIDIELKDNSIFIKSLDTNFRLQREVYDFPLSPKIDGQISYKISAKDLKKAIQTTLVSVVDDEVRPILRGIFMEVNKGINFVSLDGYRLSLISFDLDTDYVGSVIFPASSARELIKIINDEEDIEVYNTTDGIFFKFDDTIFFSRLIAGNFFDYKSMISKDSKYKIEVSQEDFKKSLERAMILKRDNEPQGVILTFNDNEMLLDNQTEMGGFNDFLATKGDGEGLKIKFNTQYLLQGLSQFDSSYVRLFLDGSLKPMIIKNLEDDRELYLVLPTRL